MPVFNSHLLSTPPPQPSLIDAEEEEFQSADEGEAPVEKPKIMVRRKVRNKTKRNVFQVNLEKELAVFKEVDPSFRFIYKNKDTIKFSTALIEMNVRDFVGITYLYEYNRPVNEAHVNSIYERMKQEIAENGKPHFFENISFFEWDDVFQVFDGQHRISALKRILLENSELNFNALFQYIHIKNNDEREELFKKRNHTLPILEEDLPEENGVYIKVCEWLKTNYKETAKGDVDEDKLIKAENFSIKEVFSKLRNFGPNARKYTFEEWKNAILERNAYLSIHISSIPNINKKVKWIERCKKKKCFLGLETNLGWLKNVYLKMDGSKEI